MCCILNGMQVITSRVARLPDKEPFTIVHTLTCMYIMYVFLNSFLPKLKKQSLWVGIDSNKRSKTKFYFIFSLPTCTRWVLQILSRWWKFSRQHLFCCELPICGIDSEKNWKVWYIRKAQEVEKVQDFGN